MLKLWPLSNLGHIVYYVVTKCDTSIAYIIAAVFD